MKHLTESEFVDRLEGALPAERERHVDNCRTCRAMAAALGESLARASAADVPEPSPLFWDHFSARVHDAVRESMPDEPRGWFSWTRSATLPWVAGGAVATVLLVVAVWRSSAPVTQRFDRVPAQPTIAAVVPDADPDVFDPDADEAWALVRSVADDVEWNDDDEGSLAVRPGAAERAIASLTRAERSELAQLLAAETRM